MQTLRSKDRIAVDDKYAEVAQEISGEGFSEWCKAAKKYLTKQKRFPKGLVDFCLCTCTCCVPRLGIENIGPLLIQVCPLRHC